MSKPKNRGDVDAEFRRQYEASNWPWIYRELAEIGWPEGGFPPMCAPESRVGSSSVEAAKEATE